jgi:hypothetical protein
VAKPSETPRPRPISGRAPYKRGVGMPLDLTKEEVATAENAVRAFVHGKKGFQSLLADLKPVVWNITSADIVETLLHFMTMDDLAEWKKPATGSTLYMHFGELTKSDAGMRLLTALMVYACFVSYDDTNLFVHVLVHASENAADTIASMDDWSTRRGILKITDRTETILKQAAALAPQKMPSLPGTGERGPRIRMGIGYDDSANLNRPRVHGSHEARFGILELRRAHSTVIRPDEGWPLSAVSKTRLVDKHTARKARDASKTAIGWRSSILSRINHDLQRKNAHSAHSTSKPASGSRAQRLPRRAHVPMIGRAGHTRLGTRPSVGGGHCPDI